jgi:uncharacterized protein
MAPVRALPVSHEAPFRQHTEKYQTVTGYDQAGVEINAQRYDYSLIVMPEVPPRPGT